MIRDGEEGLTLSDREGIAALLFVRLLLHRFHEFRGIIDDEAVSLGGAEQRLHHFEVMVCAGGGLALKHSVAKADNMFL